MPNAADVWVVLVTTDTAESARALARAVVRGGYAACVNIVPGVTSVYVWEGAEREDTEYLLVIKTTPACYPALEVVLREQHTYTTPEVLALPSCAVSADYAAWVHRQCTGRPS
ncbi:MAG: divalent-cation tolerance protein CutA [Acidobacteriota bacterium]